MQNTLPKTITAIILTFKLILNLNDNWETYKKNNKYKIREVEIREVEKMLSCMDPKKGYSVYIPDKHFKMVRYFGIHARRAKKSIREVMEKLDLVVNYLIKPFSWRKNIKKYTGKAATRILSYK